MMIRIVVDFNAMKQDVHERVPIYVEAQPEIELYLAEGKRVLLCDSDLEVEGNLEFDEHFQGWMAKPDWSTMRDI